MKIYEVILKNGALRYYGYDSPCAAGDMVVADTSHGIQLATVTKELDPLPDDLDIEKMRFLLCRVPVEKSAEIKSKMLALQDHKVWILTHLAELDARMDELMKQRKKKILRHIFAGYCEEFSELLDEYDALKAQAGFAEALELEIDRGTSMDANKENHKLTTGQYFFRSIAPSIFSKEQYKPGGAAHAD